MSEPLVPDDLWEAIAPFLPKEPPEPKGGRPRVSDRAALGGIVFILPTGCPWQLLPKELRCGSGATRWRRLRDWHAADVWERLHTRLLNWLGDEAAIDRSRASVNSLSVGAKGGRADRAEPGRPRQRPEGTRLQGPLVVDRTGIPLAARPSAANAHDSTQLLPLVDAIPSIIGPRGRPGRPRKRPTEQHAEKAYDSSDLRRALRAPGITPRIARRGAESSERLGRHRWVVGRPLAWLLRLACALLCRRFLR